MNVTAKDILAWVKSHIVIVISTVFILAVLPVAFFFSTTWLKKIVKTQEETATKELSAVKGAEIEYRLRQIDPSQPAISEKNAPNAALIEHFKKANEKLEATAQAAAVKGSDFNKGVGAEAASIGRKEFKPLVDGLFPKPVLTEEQSKSANARDIFDEQEALRLNDMEDALLGKRGKANPYGRLMAEIGAGGPLEAQRLEETIRDMRTREVEKITSNARGLTEEEGLKLKAQLQDRRLAELQARARSLGVYMTMDALTRASASTPGSQGRNRGRTTNEDELSAIAFERIAPEQLKRPQLFLKQWDLWLLSDLLTSVRLANQGTATSPVGIDKGVVKRIERIEILMPEKILELDKKGSGDAELDALQAAEPETAPTSDVPAGMVPLDKSKSITGRVRGGWNDVYEVRRAKLTCVVSSARLNEFLAAIAKTNYVSVTDLDLTEVDSWAALAEGYYYGDEHVVRASIEIESIWLKSWLVPMMPEELRKALGMKVEEAAPPA